MIQTVIVGWMWALNSSYALTYFLPQRTVTVQNSLARVLTYDQVGTTINEQYAVPGSWASAFIPAWSSLESSALLFEEHTRNSL